MRFESSVRSSPQIFPRHIYPPWEQACRQLIQIHVNNNGIGDLDPACWPNSHWRSVKVSWDESTAGERQPRVSLWEIEPLTTFPMYPSFFPLRLKRPWYPGPSSFQVARIQRLASTRLVKIFSRRNHFGNLHVMVIANSMFFQTLYFNIIRKSGLCFSVHDYVRVSFSFFC
ncbi:putative auxin response factor [Helianthus annuus]|nr:hypothetical protein HanIR_Chr05g0223691 [Helianthus annuus]KAJ0746671.1 putative auxin response factor [Helianthus annuus]KAJ0788223.1 putative auxin response factor [Helianthus annuus]